MKLFSITDDRAVEVRPGADASVRLPENAMLELRWDAPVVNWILRVSSGLRTFPKKKIASADRIVLGTASDFGGQLTVMEMDANGGSMNRLTWKYSLEPSAHTPAPPVAKAPETAPAPPATKAPETAPAPGEVHAVEALQRQKDALTASIEALKDAQRRLKDENADLEAKLRTLDARRGELHDLAGELKSAELDIQDKTRRMEALRAQIGALDDALLESESELSRKQAALSSLQARGMDAERAIEELESLRASMGMRDQEIDRAREAVAQKEVQRAALNQKDLELQAEIDRLNDSEAARRAECKRLSESIAALTGRNEQLADHAEQLSNLTQERLAGLRQRIAELFEGVSLSREIEMEIRSCVQLSIEALRDEAFQKRLHRVEALKKELEDCSRRSKEISDAIFDAVYQNIEASSDGI